MAVFVPFRSFRIETDQHFLYGPEAEGELGVMEESLIQNELLSQEIAEKIIKLSGECRGCSNVVHSLGLPTSKELSFTIEQEARRKYIEGINSQAWNTHARS